MYSQRRLSHLHPNLPLDHIAKKAIGQIGNTDTNGSYDRFMRCVLSLKQADLLNGTARTRYVRAAMKTTGIALNENKQQGFQPLMGRSTQEAAV
jgi:hypothetical protein